MPYLDYWLNRRDADRDGRVARAVSDRAASQRGHALFVRSLRDDPMVADSETALPDRDPARAAEALRAMADELSRRASGGS